MSDSDACTSCGSTDVTGWVYFCDRHDPMIAREAIVGIFARAMMASDAPGLEEFWATFAPLHMPDPGPMLRVGSAGRILFELGRAYERTRHFDRVAQEVLEAVLASRHGEKSA